MKEQYSTTVWYKTNADLTWRTINLFDWDKVLCINDVDKQVAIFSDTLMSIMHNFVPNETLICHDRDPHG